MITSLGPIVDVPYTDAAEIRNTDDSRCSGTKRLFTSWLLVFRHEERERHNFYYADCPYIAHSHLPNWTSLPRVKSQLIPF